MKPHEQVLLRFTELTGIAFRIVPHYVERQACAFTKFFSLEDLEKVVSFLRWKLATRASGFTTASYSWRKLFGDHGAGDEWLCFQERLGQADEALKRGVWKPKFAKPAEPPDPEPAGFRAWMIATYPKADPHMRWQTVPDLVKQEYREAIQ